MTTATLTLHLNGAVFQTQEIEIPDLPELSFEARVDARTEFVRAKAAELKIMYLRAIIKMEFQYHITLTITSPTHDAIQIPMDGEGG